MKEKNLKELNSLKLQAVYEQAANFSRREADKMYYEYQAEKEALYRASI